MRGYRNLVLPAIKNREVIKIENEDDSVSVFYGMTSNSNIDPSVLPKDFEKEISKYSNYKPTNPKDFRDGLTIENRKWSVLHGGVNVYANTESTKRTRFVSDQSEDVLFEYVYWFLGEKV